MGTYTGTSGDDEIRSSLFGWIISAGVVRVPPGSTPSDKPDILKGLAGNDTLAGVGGNDILNGDSGNDNLQGEDGNDTLNGGTGNDSLSGSNGEDGLFGGVGNDWMNGGAGNDNLQGGGGNDTLEGATGDDKLHGGAGTDQLNGHSGDDIYVFDSTNDSAAGMTRDVVQSFFSEGVDKIDVSTIDANVNLAGNQAFKFIGTAPLTGAGQISVFDDAGGKTIIQLSTDGDSAAESEIQVNDGAATATSWSSADFILTDGTPPKGNKPEIEQVETFREGDLVFFSLSYTDPNNDAIGFGFHGTNGSGWGEETLPFSSPSYGRISPGKVEYPFNHACDTGPAYESDVEAWIYDSAGHKSDPISIHFACSAPSAFPDIA
jgi:Ca2+-binding RTX toxin-like protein